MIHRICHTDICMIECKCAKDPSWNEKLKISNKDYPNIFTSLSEGIDFTATDGQISDLLLAFDKHGFKLVKKA